MANNEPKPSKSPSTRSPAKPPPRGRSGGRAGGAGYHFQDIYVASQLAKLLVGCRDRPVEILWEKKAVQTGKRTRAEPVQVDDTIIHWESGKWSFVQVKQASPGKEWSAKEFVRSGVAGQFWDQWGSRCQADRARTSLCLATAGDCRRLRVVIDVALRARTTAELLGLDATKETLQDIEAIADGLGVSANDAGYLFFLKSLQVEALPEADELENRLIQSLAVFGASARDIASRLISLVARSKHQGPAASSSHSQASLIRSLLDDGVPKQTLMVAGLIRLSRTLDDSFWPNYREKVVRAFRTLRVYGLDTERPVYADLPSLFVPLKLAQIDTEQETPQQAKKAEPKRRYLDEMLFDQEKESETRPEDDEVKGRADTLDLAAVLSDKRRIALIGGPGAGKTTTLKWCAIVSALPGREGRALRLKFGLPTEPLNPVYVRFRDFARWVQANGLDGMEGKHGLVANFVAATFVRDFGDKFPSRMEAFTVASELLASGKTLFLFDGLDEVQDESMRNRLFASVANLLEEYKPPRAILSSRPYAFSRPHPQLGLELFEPLPLNRQARHTFALQWYRAINGHLDHAMTEKEATARAEDLSRTAERVNDAAENPLLLSILALIHFNKNGLPVERAKLYDHATLAMLGHWDRSPSGRDLGENTIPPDWNNSLALSEPQIRQVVEHLAHRVQFSRADSEFPKEEALQALAQGIGRVSSPTLAQERAELLLRLLVERSGLLQERSPEVFAFTHFSFQEYLAARMLLAETEASSEKIARAAAEERHTEVVRFATAILAADTEPDAKLKVLELLPRIAEYHPSLAAACLLEAPGLSLEPTAAEGLARQVFQECSGRGRFYHRPRLVSRLIWPLLRQTQDPDRLLLEFLAAGGEGHRHPMEDEIPVALLAGRPSGPPSQQLEWMLAHLEKAKNRDHYPVNLGKLARLILTEEGIERPEANLQHLVELVDREDHLGGQIGNRAKCLLLRYLSGDRRKLQACRTILAGLRSPGGAIEDSWTAWRVAQSMRTLGLNVGPEFADVLVRHGLSVDSARPQCSLQIREFLKIPSARRGVLEALKTGLSNQDSDVRLECAKIMREMKLPRATPEHEVLTKSSIRDTIEEAGKRCNWKPEDSEDDWKSCASPIQDLLRDPKTHDEAMSILVEKLWSRKTSETCFAAVMLLEAGLGHTPGVIQTLVNDGLASAAWRSAASKYLHQLKLNPQTTHAVTAALTEGLSGRTDKVAADVSRKEDRSRAQEDCKKEDNAVATACAVVLLEMGETKNARLLSTILVAAIRDAEQANTVAAHLLKLLHTDLRAKISRELAEFFADESMDAGVASAIATALADAGCLDIPNLSRGLVLGGFWDEKNHARVSQFLLTMLQAPRFATDVREGLSEGLASDDAEVAWGAASFLCKHSERTDPDLAAALIRAGLNKDSRRRQAQTWLRELITNPFTAPTALKAMHKAAQDGLDKTFSTTHKNPSLSWEVARCLLLEGKNEASYLPDAIVYGGLPKSENHVDVVALVKPFIGQNLDVEKQLVAKLWTALTPEDRKSKEENPLSWGAARVLIETGQLNPENKWWLANPQDDQGEGSDKDTDKLLRLLRVVLRKTNSEPVAQECLDAILEAPETTAAGRRALMTLLDDDTPDVALAAARTLVQLGDLDHLSLAVAVCKYGLGRDSTHKQALEIIDKLQSVPSMVQAVRTALLLTAWGKDEEAAQAAAEYLMDKGDFANPAIPRGLIQGRSRWRKGGGQDTIQRLQRLINETPSKAATVDAMLAALYQEEKHSPQFDLVSLLIQAGVPFYDKILKAMADASKWGMTIAPLSLVALTGRQKEALEGAKRFAFAELSALLSE